MATKPGRVALQSMLKIIAQPLVEAVEAAAKSINGSTIFAADGNEPVDQIIALGTLRNRLMACATTPAAAEGDDVTLVIYV